MHRHSEDILVGRLQFPDEFVGLHQRRVLFRRTVGLRRVYRGDPCRVERRETDVREIPLHHSTLGMRLAPLRYELRGKLPAE